MSGRAWTRRDRWSRPTNDEFAEHWAALAKTPETRARIRRLSRIRNISLGIVVTGIGLIVVMILVTIVLSTGLWLTRERDTIIAWGFGIATGVFLIGVVPETIASNRLHRAQYADADSAIGIIESVATREERDAEGDVAIVHCVAVTARLSDDLTLHRHLESTARGSDRPDDTWVGRRIRFRHNTLNPDALDDARFDGWPDRER
ncbi:hypothetical protein [Gordonia hydrophobica]|uniref:DUF3239 domain-containing protein n=1 Tax=Gordonia hydrophobica TaxID=40516 RepID=A0ABZ2U5G4_9ACTN|nr:hypothetical protein [Gordonia hydrophobica]MBM7368663.1 hypothetical protein [Gordonia hydrophobica]